MKVSGTRNRMWRTDYPCPRCKSPLYKTILEGRMFCKKCWEYLGDLDA